MASRSFIGRWSPLVARRHINGGDTGFHNKIGPAGRLSTLADHPRPASAADDPRPASAADHPRPVSSAAASGQGEKGRFRLIVDDYFLGVHLSLVVVYCYYGYKTVTGWMEWEAKCHEYDQAIEFEREGFSSVHE